VIVHIGLGKTGTTSLQKAVFPRLVEEGVIENYNPPQIMESLRRFVVTGEGGKELKTELSNLSDKTLISLESLAGWNPAIWKQNASKNASIFPESSTIIITLRDAESYLTSVYVQMLHQGSVMKPESFILSDPDYDMVAPLARPSLCEVFKVDNLDFEYLVELYKKRFSKVIVVPVSKLSGLGFISYLFEMPQSSLSNLRQQFLNSKKENISYSKRAVRLTFLRERLLSHFGLRSKSSHDRFFEMYSGESKWLPSAWNVRNKSILVKLYIKIRARCSWRFLMQQVVDRFFAYEKYQLPDHVPRGRSLDANNEYYRVLTELDRDYLVIEAGQAADTRTQPFTNTSVD